MALRYYDDAVVYKLKKWIPDSSKLRVLKPDETRKFFELKANDDNDKAFQLPFIALSRNNDIELLSTIKQSKSYDGLKIYGTETQTAQFNVLPIKLNYQLDIYTKTVNEGDEYLRNFLFKLINNPVIIIEIEYNGLTVKHIANIRVADTVSDTSAIEERRFSGQFNRWTIQFEIQDAFFFSVPYKNNWKIMGVDLDVLNQEIYAGTDVLYDDSLDSEMENAGLMSAETVYEVK